MTEKVLVLRTVKADMTAHGGFKWPESGICEALDWDPSPSIECGKALHGLLWGSGDWSLLSKGIDAVWQLVMVDPADGLVIGKDKVRFKRGEVVYSGDQAGAMTRLLCSPEAFERTEREA